jgi:predicted acylesterase/phospholipase RssA
MRRRDHGSVLALSVAVLWTACAGCAHRSVRFDVGARRTCLVLSAGGTRGVAELGALAAIRQARVPISCVVGTSVGALVGALYASAPEADTTARFHHLTGAYLDETRRDARARGVGAGLALGALAAALSGGALLPATAALGGYVLGAATVTQAHRGRFERVLEAELGGVRIEALPTAFATLHHEREGAGLRVVVDSSGDLARAVGASIANPFVFDDVDVATAAALDPGSDRLAATPVDEACRLFPASNLLVVNVSGAPAVRTAGATTCPIREVMVDVAAVAPESLLARERDPTFEGAWRAGYDRTAAALDGA